MEAPPSLTKSRFLLGLQCPRLLWLSVHEPDMAAQPDEFTRSVFGIGHAVGETARLCFPGGVLVAENHTQIRRALETTKRLLDDPAVPALFEAAFEAGGMLCRADALRRVDDGWDLYEVKAATRVKQAHVYDAAFQTLCARRAGVPVRRTCVVHLDRAYVRSGPIEPRELFYAADMTRAVERSLPPVKRNAARFLAVLREPDCPQVAPGPQCVRPYVCPFYDRCNSGTPQRFTLERLPGITQQTRRLIERSGAMTPADIPATVALPARAAGVVRSLRSRAPAVDRNRLRRFLSTIRPPVRFLDFELFAPAIPLFDGCRPFDALPFQFCLMTRDGENGRCDTVDFLFDRRGDPRQALAEALLERIGDRGSIVAFGAASEKQAVSELAAFLPSHAARLTALLPRFVDLMVPFKNGAYAHYELFDSISLKSVGQLLAPGIPYDAIADGGVANMRYTLWQEGGMDGASWERTRPELLAYCRTDAAVMAEILRALETFA